MLDHISLQVADLDASAAFYEAVLPTIGGGRIMSYGNQIGYGVGQQPTFWIGTAGPAGPATDVHVAFAAPDRASVRAWFDAAVATGAEVIQAAPPLPRVPPDLLRRLRPRPRRQQRRSRLPPPRGMTRSSVQLLGQSHATAHPV